MEAGRDRWGDDRAAVAALSFGLDWTGAESFLYFRG